MHLISEENLSFRIFVAIVALGLVLVMLSHDVIPHEHHEYLDSGIQAMAHSQDRKWWISLAFTLFFISILAKYGRTSQVFNTPQGVMDLYRKNDGQISLLNPLRIALRRGILQPKVY